ncbi:MAG: type II secretion system protein GspG [Acidobacteriia bacterium]|nr:type II secretion system protein GspG [Terriglobia bacterium]
MKAILRILIILPMLWVSTSCGGGASAREKQVAGAVESLQLAHLKPTDYKVTSFEPKGNDTALLVADVHTAFLMKKNSRGTWEVQSIRVGDREWEDAKLVAQALNQVKLQKVKNDFEILANAIDQYRAKNNTLPQARSIGDLDDTLYPKYLSSLIRLDPWSTEYAFNANSPTSYTLMSAGPDRKFGTADDIRFER